MLKYASLRYAPFQRLANYKRIDIYVKNMTILFKSCLTSFGYAGGKHPAVLPTANNSYILRVNKKHCEISQ
jgi:hypothetical protein